MRLLMKFPSRRYPSLLTVILFRVDVFPNETVDELTRHPPLHGRDWRRRVTRSVE